MLSKAWFQLSADMSYVCLRITPGLTEPIQESDVLALLRLSNEGMPLVPRQHHEPTGTVPGTMSQLQAERLERKSNERISPLLRQQLQIRTAAPIH